MGMYILGDKVSLDELYMIMFFSKTNFGAFSVNIMNSYDGHNNPRRIELPLRGTFSGTNFTFST